METNYLKTPIDTLIDKKEAPEGFVPVSKFEIKGNENVCNYCDWRRQCVENIDNACQKYPCVSTRRKDGQAVIFKLKQ